MANAARLTSAWPSTTLPEWSTKIRSETRIRPKCKPKGLTQKQSGRSGSRAVMWPATPSSKPYSAKSRKAAARRSLRWRRSSAGEVKTGGRGMRSMKALWDSGAGDGCGIGPPEEFRGHYSVRKAESRQLTADSKQKAVEKSKVEKLKRSKKT